ncbi:MAG TPA: hypothetical protein VJW51_04610 [Candidatus Acidoferrales bacterium]|nr:hypothetical protein [Candidatus Acidoferrales bacterium]
MRTGAPRRPGVQTPALRGDVWSLPSHDRQEEAYGERGQKRGKETTPTAGAEAIIPAEDGRAGEAIVTAPSNAIPGGHHG